MLYPTYDFIIHNYYIYYQILDKYKDFDFFSGDSGAPFTVGASGEMLVEGMAALLDFREDGVTPYMLFWKDGLEEEKVVSAEF